jgi:hypothetical protein
VENRTCSNCAAWKHTHAEMGECHLAPPQVVFMGFQPPRLTGQPPQPIIAGVFPACGASAACLQHRALEVEQPRSNTWYETGFVTREVPAAEMYSEPQGIPASNDPGTLPVAPALKHTPVKRNGEWECDRCGVSEDVFEAVPCKETSYAAE